MYVKRGVRKVAVKSLPSVPYVLICYYWVCTDCFILEFTVLNALTRMLPTEMNQEEDIILLGSSKLKFSFCFFNGKNVRKQMVNSPTVKKKKKKKRGSNTHLQVTCAQEKHYVT